MSSSRSWICNGQPKNGKSYPNASLHSEYENFGPDCAVCGLPREAMSSTLVKGGSGSRGRTQVSRAPQKTALAGLATLAIIGGIGWGLWQLLRGQSCPDGQEKVNGSCIAASPSPSPSPPLSPSPTSSTPSVVLSLSDRFSSGDRVLFSYRGNFDLDRGIDAFKNGNYAEAATLFEKAAKATPNNPEPQIYYNNARARQAGDPFVLAVVVPITHNSPSAEEILRGVADAQTQFNDAGGFKDQLLEVLLVNDGNEPKVAGDVARQLVGNDKVLGVVGHNSSDASAAALPIYRDAGLAMVSPTSTSTTLASQVFFRTVPSDRASGEKLAEYVANSLQLQDVVAFYDSQSSYSKSILQAFTTKFEQQLGGQVIQPPVDLSSSTLNLESEIKTASGQARAALLFPSTRTTTVAIAAARENATLPREQRLQLLGGDALYTSTTLVEGGEAVRGLVVVVPWYAQAGTSYADTAEKRWIGQISWRTASGFDATQALITTLQQGAASRSDVLRRLRSVNLSASQTSGDELQFLPNGDRTQEPLLVEAGGGAAPQGAKFGFRLLP